MDKTNKRSFRFGLVFGIVLGIVLACMADEALAAPSVYKLDLTYSKIVNNRDLQAYDIPHSQWTTAVTFEAGIAAGRYYLEPNFHFENAYQKVTTVGLEFHHGINLTSWLSLEHYHHSQHRADNLPSTGSETAYPLKDFIGVRIRFIPGELHK